MKDTIGADGPGQAENGRPIYVDRRVENPRSLSD